jgi:hypothetical protein
MDLIEYFGVGRRETFTLTVRVQPFLAERTVATNIAVLSQILHARIWQACPDITLLPYDTAVLCLSQILHAAIRQARSDITLLHYA